jgi:hypothetical protein
MATRGRPPKHGKIPGWMFGRALRVLDAYDAARISMKHSAAVTAATDSIRKAFPEMPISETTVRRILAEFRGKDAHTVIKVSKTPDEEIRRTRERARELEDAANSPECPEDAKRILMEFAASLATTKVGIRMGVGPRPEYPRSNARSL